MKSLTHYIAVIGNVTLFVILLLGLLSYSSIEKLEEAEAHLVDDIFQQQKLIDEFQNTLYLLVTKAHAFEQTGQYHYLQDAYDALHTTHAVLPKLNEVTERVETDMLVGTRLAQRQEIVEDADEQLKRLERGYHQQHAKEVLHALQRLDLVAQDANILGLASKRLLNQETMKAMDDVAYTSQLVHYSILGNVILFCIILVLLFIAVYSKVVQPLRELRYAVQEAGAGNLDQQVAVQGQHEIGTLQAGFNTMVANLLAHEQEIETRNASLEQANVQQQRMLATIKELSTPVLPVLPGVLVLPIVGYVDEKRFVAIHHNLLQAIYEQRANIVVLDITGMLLPDPSLLHVLASTTQAVRLLGAEMFLAGISAEIAPVIVQQKSLDAGIISKTKSFATLRDALETVLIERGQR